MLMSLIISINLPCCIVMFIYLLKLIKQIHFFVHDQGKSLSSWGANKLSLYAQMGWKKFVMQKESWLHETHLHGLILIVFLYYSKHSKLYRYPCLVWKCAKCLHYDWNRDFVEFCLHSFLKIECKRAYLDLYEFQWRLFYANVNTHLLPNQL